MQSWNPEITDEKECRGQKQPVPRGRVQVLPGNRLPPYSSRWGCYLPEDHSPVFVEKTQFVGMRGLRRSVLDLLCNVLIIQKPVNRGGPRGLSRAGRSTGTFRSWLPPRGSGAPCGLSTHLLCKLGQNVNLSEPLFPYLQPRLMRFMHRAAGKIRGS